MYSRHRGGHVPLVSLLALLLPGAVAAAAPAQVGPITDPRLLVPPAAAGLILSRLNAFPNGRGLTADFVPTQKVHAAASLRVASTDDPLPGPATATIGEHPAHVAMKPEASVSWRSGEWLFTLKLRSAGRASPSADELKACAVGIAAWADDVLRRASLARDSERRAHVAALEGTAATLREASSAAGGKPELKLISDEKHDGPGKTIMASWRVINMGASAARFAKTCKIRFESAGNPFCRTKDYDTATFQVMHFTRAPPESGRKTMLPSAEVATALERERILLPGGEALVWRKVKLADFVKCDLSRLSAALVECTAEPAFAAEPAR